MYLLVIVIFLTQDMLHDMDTNTSWSNLPYGSNSNRIHTKYLQYKSIEEIYEKNYIYASQTLLGFEEQYQLSKGNIEKAKKCRERLKEINRLIKKSENDIKKRNRRGRISELIQRVNNAIKRESVKNKKEELNNSEINSSIINDNNQKQDNDPFRTWEAR